MSYLLSLPIFPIRVAPSIQSINSILRIQRNMIGCIWYTALQCSTMQYVGTTQYKKTQTYLWVIYFLSTFPASLLLFPVTLSYVSVTLALLLCFACTKVFLASGTNFVFWYLVCLLRSQLLRAIFALMKVICPSSLFPPLAAFTSLKFYSDMLRCHFPCISIT